MRLSFFRPLFAGCLALTLATAACGSSSKSDGPSSPDATKVDVPADGRGADGSGGSDLVPPLDGSKVTPDTAPELPDVVEQPDPDLVQPEVDTKEVADDGGVQPIDILEVDIPDLAPETDLQETSPEETFEILDTDLVDVVPEVEEIVDVAELSPDLEPDLSDTTEPVDLVMPDLAGFDLLIPNFELPPGFDIATDFFPDVPPLCTSDEECQAGVKETCIGEIHCVEGKCEFDPTVVKECPPSETPCYHNVCVPEVGLCEESPAPAGAPCDDNDPLTLVDMCFDGECQGFEPVSCVADYQCEDLYDCTDDACVGGECVNAAVACEPVMPVECEVGVCTHGIGCELKAYADADPVVYLETFEDGIAQGWALAGSDFPISVAAGPSGDEGLAISLEPTGGAVVLLPELYLPPSLLLLSVGFEMWDQEQCDDVLVTAFANGQELGEISLCEYSDPEVGQVGLALPADVYGAVSMQFVIANDGPQYVDMSLTTVHVEMQAGEWCCVDFDLDGMLDCLDNCTEEYNPEQEDCDGDLIGDACDEDKDNDGVEDKYDAYPCDPGSVLPVRRVATRITDPIQPTAVACREGTDDSCYLFDWGGEHLTMDRFGRFERVVEFDVLGLARSAAFCSGYLWVLDGGPIVYGYDVSDISRPELLFSLEIPNDFTSLYQVVASNEGDVVVSGGQYLYVLEAGGDADQFFDAQEEVVGLAMTEEIEQFLSVTRSPQAPNHFFMRVHTIDDDLTIYSLKTVAEEAEPTCFFGDMTEAGWGSGNEPGSAPWITLTSCQWPFLWLVDPWYNYYGTADLDGDGIEDLLDQDDDGDGVADLDDLAPLDHLTWKDDDGDGAGNHDDWDDDGDGVSDNYVGLAGPVLETWFTVDGVEGAGLDYVQGHVKLLTAGGELLSFDAAGNQTGTEDLPLGQPDGFAAAGDSYWAHDIQWKGLARFGPGGADLWLDSPEVALNMMSLSTDLTVDGNWLWVGLWSTNRLYLLDMNGSIRMEIRLPAAFRGVAVAGEALWVLMAVSDDRSALLKVDRSGGFLGMFDLPGGLTKLAVIDDETLATLAPGAGAVEVQTISLPAGLELLEVEPGDLDESILNPTAVIAPHVPVETGADWALITWDVPSDTAGLTLQACRKCGSLTGYMPPQNCEAVDLSSGLATLSGLSVDATCAVELWTESDWGGTVASRRVTIDVGQPGSGAPLWSKAGGLDEGAWKLIMVPGILAVD